MSTTIKSVINIASAVLLVLCLAVIAQAVNISVTTKNISNGLPTTQDRTITFPNAVSTDTFKLANEYVELFYQPYDGVTNLPQKPHWRVDLFTNNPTSQPGLINTTRNLKIPVAWVSSTSANVQLSTYSAISGGWNWLKDVGETDWASSYANLYTMVQSQGSPISISSQTKNIFFEANFVGASAETFQTNVWFEIYQVADFKPPTITHDALTAIAGTGNVLRFRATVQDDQEVNCATVAYKIDSGSWVVAGMTPLAGGSITNEDFEYTIKQADFVDATKIYYYLIAQDGAGNESYWNNISSANPQVIVLRADSTFLGTTSGQLTVPDGNPDDGNTTIDIPVGALSSPVDITITQKSINSAPQRSFGNIDKDKPVMTFEFAPEGLHFAKPVKLTMLYFDVDNDDKVELPDGTETNIKPEDLKVCWYDGFEWRLIGGVLDKKTHTLSVYIDHFSNYALFYQGSMSAADYRPKEKIITPATVDGINDYASFDGLNGSDFSIKIFDINGRNIRTINSPDLPRWDGKDASGNIVESGAYIYQFKADVDGKMKLISGTVIIAK